MFICGQAYRPDIALEIAISVRKREWKLRAREALAFSYSRGKRKYLEGDEGNKLFNMNILKEGLEKSVESELGVLFPSSRKKSREYRRRGGIENIRIITKNN